MCDHRERVERFGVGLFFFVIRGDMAIDSDGTLFSVDGAEALWMREIPMVGNAALLSLESVFDQDATSSDNSS